MKYLGIIFLLAAIFCLAESMLKTGFYLPNYKSAWTYKYRLIMSIVGGVMFVLSIIFFVLSMW